VTRALVLAIAGTLLCLTHCAGPARAEMTTAFALRSMCARPEFAAIAPMVDRASADHGIEPLHLAAVIAAESRCVRNAKNPITGAIGLGQVLPAGSANPSRLSEARLYDPRTNIDLTAAHLARCLALCGALGGGIGEAISVYNGHRLVKHRGAKRCPSARWATRVLGMLETAREKWRREARS
jgi:soluble lytic murein transglycosylase-like protein